MFWSVHRLADVGRDDSAGHLSILTARLLSSLSTTEAPLVVRYGIRFDDGDLKANKSGKLSRRQQALLRGRGLQLASIAGAVAILSADLAILVNVGALVLLVAAEPASLAAFLYLWGSRAGSVAVEVGPVQVRRWTVFLGNPMFFYHRFRWQVGRSLFRVPPGAYNPDLNGVRVRLYFAPKTKSVLSVEELSAAQATSELETAHRQHVRSRNGKDGGPLWTRTTPAL